jgi:hypothetical protein
MPAIPTPEQCHDMELADNQVVSNFLYASQAEEESQYGNNYATGRLQMQERDTAEWMQLGQEASARYTQCLREAQAAQQASSGGLSAWMSGIGAVPDGAFSGVTGGGLTGFTALAAKTIQTEQQIESWNLRLGVAQNLIGTLLSGQPPSGDLQSRVWQGVDLANDLRGEVAPPWSVFATTLAVNGIRAISQNSMSQLDDAMAQFDAVAISDLVTGSIDTTVRNDLAQAAPPINNLPGNAMLDALSGLDGVVQQMAELAQEVGRQVAAERQANAARRLAEERANQRQAVTAAPPPVYYSPPQISPPYVPPAPQPCAQREALTWDQVQQGVTQGACLSP